MSEKTIGSRSADFKTKEDAQKWIDSRPSYIYNMSIEDNSEKSLRYPLKVCYDMIVDDEAIYFPCDQFGGRGTWGREG